MYRSLTSADKSDYMQLGWLVAWILDKDVEKLNYHERYWGDHSLLVQGDQFTHKLIDAGDYMIAVNWPDQ